eukprot:TRINITY_DN79685_c0_g1_i1.p1 TRINITY_DN79685_c0_g1~~TRINITY_DN79685_c0_g1_i1.p1  ORF type:complete len:281 (+),score=48.79 TRINITY_DN79685_c0_g1_i1:117-845(+)
MDFAQTAQAHRGLLAAAEAVTGDYVAPAARDTYFANEPNLIAPFDFDYDTIIDFEKRLKWTIFMFTPPAWMSSCCCVPCFLNQNIEWDTRSQHVALTMDGIRFVKEKRKSLCGLPCSDKGRESKTVPYDKITDCDVQEPAGMACCCCVENRLSVVHIDTASSGGASAEGGVRHELVLKGLVEPSAFKHSVWGMKRRIAPAGATVPLGSPPLAAPAQQNMTVLLTEIRDELRTLNRTMAAASK